MRRQMYQVNLHWHWYYCNNDIDKDKKITSAYAIGFKVGPLEFSFGTRLAGIRFIERYIDDANDATNTLRILQTMVRTDKHVHKFIIENGGMETMVKAMKRYNKESDGVAASGSGLIEAVCGCSSETDKKLMECGAIRMLVEAMKQWPDDEEVQAQAAQALNRLAAGKFCVIHKKIIDAEARTRHQHDVRVQQPTTQAIMSLLSQIPTLRTEYASH
ncbi:hypothetical protein ACHAWO_010826 [Cyclotella atomus]|uniref:Uncharacterized protein n=1 Tax=Cyclotella atomus TaxID=382360 RepID=A0ABD3QHC6_9STRA